MAPSENEFDTPAIKGRPGWHGSEERSGGSATMVPILSNIPHRPLVPSPRAGHSDLTAPAGECTDLVL